MRAHRLGTGSIKTLGKPDGLKKMTTLGKEQLGKRRWW